jgi:hypothetical protein
MESILIDCNIVRSIKKKEDVFVSLEAGPPRLSEISSLDLFMATDSTRNAVGYAIISLHAFTLVMGIMMSATCDLVKIALGTMKRVIYDVSAITCRRPMRERLC